MDAARTADSIVMPNQHGIPPHTPPTAIAAVLPLSLSAVTTKPRKLTPLEKKDRDRLRMKEQARRRQQAIKDQYDQAKRLMQEQQSSSMWHRQERQEEELVLRRLERDAVDVQRLHPAAAGYSFDSPSQTATTSSPVFISYSHALCPASQAPRCELQSRGGLLKVHVSVEAEYVHPACHGYAMAKHDDSRCISPVFFLTGFAKIPLDKVVMEKDNDQSEEEEDEEQEGGSLEESAFDGKGGASDVSDAVKARQQETQRRLQAAMAVRRSLSTTLVIDESEEAPVSPRECLICKQRDVTQGCPGCFSFSGQKYRGSEASKANQRLKTPKTHLQEEQDRCDRHKALQKQLIMPPLIARSPQQRPDGSDKATVTFSVEEDTQDDESSYYSNVLADFRAIRKHRSIANKFVTLHVKSLPVGQFVSLRVSLKSSVAYLYELYRANSELPNRPLHLLLPTARGLFYLNEQIEAATYTRNGVINGELLLEDFNLQKSASLALGGRGNGGSTSNESEFLLFSVAILHPQSTPQLVSNYVQQNIRFEPQKKTLPIPTSPIRRGGSDDLPPWAKLVSAAFLLPNAVDQDPFQLQLRPYLHEMHVFAQTNHAIVAAEQREERERLLLLAHQEAKMAKLALKKKQREQQQPDVSNKVRRALVYFEFALESTSNPRQPHVAEERLGKLWLCMQMLEEWKILKGSRLLDAERTDVMLALMQQLQEATAAAFTQMLDSGKKAKREEGGGAMPYPVLCLDGGRGESARKLVLRLGTRLGATQQEDHDYGMVLDLDQDFDALEKNESRMLKRNVTKRSVATQDNSDSKQPAVEAWDDVEWRTKGKSSATMALLASSPDLLRAPFHQIKWPLIAKAYKLVLRRVAFTSAKLDEFNALAKVLQSPEAVLSKAQLAKWQADVEGFVATLPEQSALARATHRVLAKKGVAVLKKRAQARRQQLREREKEMERLRQLQEERERPKLTLAQQLKLSFVKERAPKMREAVELTPAEKLGVKAGELLGKAASGVVSVVRSAKKEYAVRTL